MCDIELKATNEHDKQTTGWWSPGGSGEAHKGEGSNMVTEGDLTSGGERATRHTDDVFWDCTPDTDVILLTSVAPINVTNKRHSNKTQSEQR